MGGGRQWDSGGLTLVMVQGQSVMVKVVASVTV
jgi:hypothetical protein